MLSAPTLTNPNGLSVTYSSDDETIATVDASGNVTGIAIGTTNIIVTFSGNETYKSGSVSYTIKVKKTSVAPTDGVFDFTYADEIDYGTSLKPSSEDIKVSKTFTAGNVTLTPEPTATNKYWRWWTDGTLRLYTDTKMTIAVSDGYVITGISFTGTQNLNAITASIGNYEAASDKKSATWTGCSQSIVFTRGDSNPFFKRVTVTYTTANQSITPAKTYTTLTSAYPLDFTSVNSDLKAYIATEISGGYVQMTQVDKVPANTGLVLKATTPGSAISVPVLSGDADDVSTNKMTGSAFTTTAVAANGGYILSDGVFQPANAGDLPAGKAYLDIAVSSARALTMSFGDEEPTGIGTVNSEEMIVEGYYNLSGQRVAQPQKGLYIVNGRKVLVK